ncbi:hypothetical protein L5515_016840 [Caenorhabditis briggsae]|uniref:PHD-type domain-containing protein n=1 Tax=Caenorhabditis briggsae TaxID=6238 RepID=A0AAE9JQH3_CAEBR|nr:hypothetical protein L5515_016840 [Caenorhabditis briggsae]
MSYTSYEDHMDLFLLKHYTIANQIRADQFEINRLDQEVNAITQDINDIKLVFMANVKSLSQEQKIATMQLLETEQKKILDISRTKFALVSRMTQAMSRNQAKGRALYESFESYRQGSNFNEESQGWKARQTLKTKKTLKRQQTAEAPQTSRALKNPKAPQASAADVAVQPAAGNAPEVLKQYCICQDTKTDTMIFCENPRCKYEWYHFSCIGMETAPEGEWFCEGCTKKKNDKQSGKENQHR